MASGPEDGRAGTSRCCSIGRWAPWPGGCGGPWWTWSYSACARVDAYVPPDLGEQPVSTTEFVPHDEAQRLEAALAINETEDDDAWRASLRRKAPRMALDATTLKKTSKY